MQTLHKYSTFYIFLILIAIWAAFFSSIKFFLWGELSTSLQPDLQTITGYLSFGSMFAYLIGGAFAVTFLKKYYLFIISLLSLIFIAFSYFIGFENQIVFAFIIIFLGFLYGLWSVVKNVVLAIEIEKTGLSDTVINAIAGIVFVIFIIGGTLLGNILFEHFGRHGYIVIMIMLMITGGLSLCLNYNKRTFSGLIKLGWTHYYHERKVGLTQALKLYLPDLKYICKNYMPVMIASSLLWSISTVVSQVSMEYSIVSFSIQASTASYIFLYSALGAILGNIVSTKMGQKRWLFWIIFSLLFSLLVIVFPFLSLSFVYMSVLAFFLGLFFGVSSNLIDGFFIKTIGKDNKKEYGASTYGFILSFTLFLMMFLSNTIDAYFGYTILMIFLGILMGVTSIILYTQQKSI